MVSSAALISPKSFTSVENLQNIYLEVLESESFKQEFNQLLRDYVGRPSPFTWQND